MIITKKYFEIEIDYDSLNDEQKEEFNKFLLFLDEVEELFTTTFIVSGLTDQLSEEEQKTITRENIVNYIFDLVDVNKGVKKARLKLKELKNTKQKKEFNYIEDNISYNFKVEKGNITDISIKYFLDNIDKNYDNSVISLYYEKEITKETLSNISVLDLFDMNEDENNKGIYNINDINDNLSNILNFMIKEKMYNMLNNELETKKDIVVVKKKNKL